MGGGGDMASECWVLGAYAASLWFTIEHRNPPCKQGCAGNGGAGCCSRGSGWVVVVPVPVLYT